MEFYENDPNEESNFEEVPNSALIRMNKQLVNHVKALEVRLSAMGIGIQYMAQVVDEYDHDVEEDDHMRRFMAKLVKCVAPERQFEYCEMDCEILKHALKDRESLNSESEAS